MGTGSLAATGIRGRDMGNLYCGLCKRPRAAAEFCGHTTGHTGILSSLERAWSHVRCLTSLSFFSFSFFPRFLRRVCTCVPVECDSDDTNYLGSIRRHLVFFQGIALFKVFED